MNDVVRACQDTCRCFLDVVETSVSWLFLVALAFYLNNNGNGNANNVERLIYSQKQLAPTMTEAYEHKARKSNANEAKGHRKNVKIPLLFFVVDPASDWSPDRYPEWVTSSFITSIPYLVGHDVCERWLGILADSHRFLGDCCWCQHCFCSCIRRNVSIFREGTIVKHWLRSVHFEGRVTKHFFC